MDFSSILSLLLITLTQAAIIPTETIDIPKPIVTEFDKRDNMICNEFYWSTTTLKFVHDKETQYMAASARFYNRCETVTISSTVHTTKTVTHF